MNIQCWSSLADGRHGEDQANLARRGLEMLEALLARPEIRLNKEDRCEFEEKMNAYGYSEMSPFIRFAVRQLPRSRRAK